MKKLNDLQKMTIKGGLSFSVVLGVMSFIQTISMIVPFVTNLIVDDKKNIPTISKKRNNISYNLSQNYSDLNKKETTIFFS